MQEIKTLVVVVDSLNVGPESLRALIRRIFCAINALPARRGLVVLTIHHGLDRCSELEKLPAEFGERVFLASVDSKTFAHAYTNGLQKALTLGADLVVELDSGGGHLPEELPRFVAALEQNDVALGSRFMPGSVNKYPWQRRVVSLGVTWLVNLFFALGFKYTDAASGFQGFRAETLKRVFGLLDPKRWASANIGPFHLYQTEMRVLLALLPQCSIVEVPITYGAEKKGRPLGIFYLMRSLWCLCLIWKERIDIHKHLPRSALMGVEE